MSLIDSLGILHMENDDARSNVKYLKPTVTKVACLRCRALKRKCDGLHPSKLERSYLCFNTRSCKALKLFFVY